MTYVQLKNKDGNYVSPSSATFQAAAANDDWTKAPGFYLLLTDQSGKESWPITGATFILLHKAQDKPEVAKQVLDFFDWAYKSGDSIATGLEYIPLPDAVKASVRNSWRTEVKGPDGKPVM